MDTRILGAGTFDSLEVEWKVVDMANTKFRWFYDLKVTNSLPTCIGSSQSTKRTNSQTILYDFGPDGEGVWLSLQAGAVTKQSTLSRGRSQAGSPKPLSWTMGTQCRPIAALKEGRLWLR